MRRAGGIVGAAGALLAAAVLAHPFAFHVFWPFATCYEIGGFGLVMVAVAFVLMSGPR